MRSRFKHCHRLKDGRVLNARTMQSILCFALIVAAISLLALSPARAQAMRTYVAGTGTDSGPCTVTAPCRTLQAALNKTLPGGEIQSLDSADYGSVTITRAVTILGTHGTAGVLATNVSGITINAGPSDVINLRGLDIDGGGSGANGILFTSGAALNIDDSVIRSFANGITVSSTNQSSFSINNTSISNNTVGLSVQSSAPSMGVLSGAEVVNNGTGLTASGANASSPINLTIQGSVVANNTTVGVVSGAYSVVTVAGSMVANNGVGLEAVSTTGLLETSRSTVTGNGTGWTTANGGWVYSAGGNSIGGNLSGNSAPPTSATPPPPPSPPPPPPPAVNYLLDGAGNTLLDSTGGKLTAP